MYRILGLLSVLIIGASIAQAQQTHIVDLAGTGDFTTIHDAVEAAASGDTVEPVWFMPLPTPGRIVRPGRPGPK